MRRALVTFAFLGLILCLFTAPRTVQAGDSIVDHFCGIKFLPAGEQRPASEEERRACIENNLESRQADLENKLNDPALRICMAAAKGTKTATGIGGVFALLSVLGIMAARRKTIVSDLSAWANGLSGIARVWYLLGFGAVCARAFFVVFLEPPFGEPSSILLAEIFFIGFAFWLTHTVSKWVYAGFKKKGAV